VILFKPRIIDEACAHTQYLENMFHKKLQPSGSKHKDTKMFPSRGRRSRKEKTRRWQLLHISERIQTTTITIKILMVKPKISVGIYIQI
jgi:hypothetical protein